MNKLLCIVIAVIFSTTATYSVADDNKIIWEDESTLDDRNIYRYKSCVVAHFLETNMLITSIWDGKNPAKDITIIRKDGGVLKILPTSFGERFITDEPGEKKKEDDFFSQCGEAVRQLPKEIRRTIFESLWNPYE